jgi:adenylate cyclase
LFCDLRGSCRIAEQDPSDLRDAWDQISQALDVMSAAITDEEGVVGDFQGDAAMGFWGWPNTQEDQIKRAVNASLRIHREFEKKRIFEGSSLHCGIGLAHGPALVGRLGTSDQFKLGAFGHTVNLAARLESLTKLFGSKILIDDAIRQYLENVVRDGPLARIRFLGKFCPAGMGECVLLSELSPWDTRDVAPINHWETGLRAFSAGDWVAAKRRLENWLRPFPREAPDKAAKFYLSFMEKYKGVPPEGWDGSVKLDQK